ncbi:CrcB family protein [Sporosarcina sp. Marseille-Q4063]|uniref:fluoride efflux transporter FluC n=1 Tax=Sporosarcina sp. Marseille-Q4063 TaxID=2810514 RepID=UPI001BAF92AE|nr:CrcB family protein [Sporosarcina sp. Marseille-Q4063]QUW23199.1 CrcB family protein [Sporosarcina sp. Marseille-Q4063]
MKTYLWIGLGGALGALTRTGIGELISHESGFPIATFLVNMIGTFLLCFLGSGVLRKISVAKHIQDAMTTGFLGSFTTFSALSMETVLLFETGQSVMGVLYVGLSIVGGIIVGLLGFQCSQKKVAV